MVENVKGISGATSPSGLDSLAVSHLQIDNLDQMSLSDIANIIKDSFLDSMKDNSPLNDFDLQMLTYTSEDVSHVDMTSPESVLMQEIKIIEL
jgi:hypothetical protein